MRCPSCGGPLNTAGQCVNWQCQPGLTPIPPEPKGCVCPPTSEQTCENPTCPRQDHTHPDLKMPKCQ